MFAEPTTCQLFAIIALGVLLTAACVWIGRVVERETDGLEAEDLFGTCEDEDEDAETDAEEVNER